MVLVGLMATGKSTVGEILAAELGRTLLDSDAHVENRTGRTVRDIWRSDGEAAFRRLESEALAAALAAEEPAVIAGAGGVVLADENRALLRGEAACVVWLRARVETVVARVAAAADEHRPLLDEDPAGMLEHMEQDRRALYAEVADHVVDVDGRSIAQVVDDVLRALGAAA